MTDNTTPQLSGSWYGNYYYASGTTPYGFEAVFIERNGAVEGNILDLGISGEASISGTFTYPRLQFRKTYYKLAKNPVDYEGTMSSDGKTLTGNWKIPPSAKGTWIAWRIEEKEMADETLTDEELEKPKEKTLVSTGT
jgi:hypothetical protein